MLLRPEHVSSELRESAKGLVPSRGKSHRPAMCAGVVASGYSLALPEMRQAARDPAGKRWEAAKQSFYADAKSLERDLSSIQGCHLEDGGC